MSLRNTRSNLLSVKSDTLTSEVDRGGAHEEIKGLRVWIHQLVWVCVRVVHAKSVAKFMQDRTVPFITWRARVELNARADEITTGELVVREAPNLIALRDA